MSYKNREKLFKNIQCAALKIPSYLSADGKNLIISLLNRNPAKRLGSGKGDANEIKKHPWFNKIDWNDANNRKLKPPKPQIKQFPKSKICAELFLDDSKDENPVPDWAFVQKPGQ